jgi:hypothetical protein
MLALIASSSDWHHHGWFWIWPFAMLLWLAVLLVAARIVFFRRGRWAAHAGPDPPRILAERNARGENEHHQYPERLSPHEDP